MLHKQRLLVSVRGKIEAIEAVKGGAHIIDAEYPASALGTQYPLNIYAIRQVVPLDRLVSTNIGEKQFVWSTASQAALGVAFVGTDIIKVGLAELNTEKATYVLRNVVHNVKYWFPWKIIIPTFFADIEHRKYIDPINDSQKVAVKTKAQGVLIDTFDKTKGKRLLDYYSHLDIEKFTKKCHLSNLEAWLAGSITKEQLPGLWKTGVDVICVRQAACAVTKQGSKRMGQVKSNIVRSLVRSIPK